MVDTVAPRVIWTNPIAGATNTATNTTVTAMFNEVMTPATLTTASFTLKKGNTAIVGTVIYAGVTTTFKPTVALEPDTTYTATIASTVTDAAGNLLDGPYVWTFTTGAVTDTVGPRVTFTVPADDAENVATNSVIAVAFTEAMDPTTLTTASFMIQQLGTAVPGTVSFSNVTAVFRPTIALAPNTVYAAVVTNHPGKPAGCKRSLLHQQQRTAQTPGGRPLPRYVTRPNRVHLRCGPRLRPPQKWATTSQWSAGTPQVTSPSSQARWSTCRTSNSLGQHLTVDKFSQA